MPSDQQQKLVKHLKWQTKQLAKVIFFSEIGGEQKERE